MKMIVVFKKSARLRFIGHLDLMRTMQRALRRSELPIRYSQGFNPHILLSFASPLSVGVEGCREIMEVPLDQDMSEDEFKRIFSAVLPEDLPCLECHAVPDNHPAPMSLCYAAAYTCVPDTIMPDLDKQMQLFINQPAIPAVRHTKSGDKPCDLKPMIHSATTDQYGIHMTLDLRESATCRADLFLDTFYRFIGYEVPHYTLHREQLYGLADGQLCPLEML